MALMTCKRVCSNKTAIRVPSGTRMFVQQNNVYVLNANKYLKNAREERAHVVPLHLHAVGENNAEKKIKPNA